MTEEQLEKAKEIQRDSKLAEEALREIIGSNSIDIIFKGNNRFDTRMNKVFHELIYPDLKLYIRTFCDIRLTMLIKNWEKELNQI